MPRRNQIQIALLAGLFLLFVYVMYRDSRSSEIVPMISSADEHFAPIAVENPELRLDLLDRLKNLDYQGSHRNIFSATLPPPPAPPVAAAAIRPAAPLVPPGHAAAHCASNILSLRHRRSDRSAQGLFQPRR